MTKYNNKLSSVNNDVKLELKNFTFHAMSIRNLICEENTYNIKKTHK